MTWYRRLLNRIGNSVALRNITVNESSSSRLITHRHKRDHNVKIILINIFALSCLVIMPVFIPFLDNLGLNLTQIMISESCYALMLTLLEVPSGWMADKFGRAKMVQVGSFFWMIGLFILIFANGLFDVILFQVSIGIGAALVSGADLSLLYESVRAGPTEAQAAENAAEKALAQHCAYRGWGGVAGSIACVILISVGFHAVVLFQAIIGAIPFIISLWLREPNKTKPHQHTAPNQRWADIIGVTKEVAKVPNTSTIFGTFVSATALGFLASFIIQGAMTQQSTALHLFVWFWVCFQGAFAASSAWSSRLEGYVRTGRALWVLPLIFLVGFTCHALGGILFWSIGTLLIGTFRGLFQPLLISRLNHALADTYRATINSILQMALRLAVAIMGPIFGWIADRYGATNALIVLSALAIPVVGLISFWQVQCVLKRNNPINDYTPGDLSQR